MVRFYSSHLRHSRSTALLLTDCSQSFGLLNTSTAAAAASFLHNTCLRTLPCGEQDGRWPEQLAQRVSVEYMGVLVCIFHWLHWVYHYPKHHQMAGLGLMFMLWGSIALPLCMILPFTSFPFPILLSVVPLGATLRLSIINPRKSPTRLHKSQIDPSFHHCGVFGGCHLRFSTFTSVDLKGCERAKEFETDDHSTKGEPRRRQKEKIAMQSAV